MKSTSELLKAAFDTGTVVPGFNIPYLPMMDPVVRALRDCRSIGLIMVARLEWEKFESGSLEAICEEYERLKDERYTRLHLDHVPVIDEDDKRVDYEEIIGRALAAGYGSVMVDGSRLSLEENIEATRRIVEIAHAANVPVEGELGAVMGHESGPLPPYEELFSSGKGFTDPDEARRFADETGVDWLSVAIGNVHGAISGVKKNEKKIAARLNIEHLGRIKAAIGIPLVLHGGSGIPKTYIGEAVKQGIAKINVGTTIRRQYEALMDTSVPDAQNAVYDTMLTLIRSELEIEGTAVYLEENV